MRVIVIGAAGAIGRAVVAELGQRHDIVTVGATRGQYQVDMADIGQVRALFARVGPADAVVVAAGALHLAPLPEMTPELFRVGLDSKLMGQVNVALVAQSHLNDGGSITLTSGIDETLPDGASAIMVNSAIEGFVRGAAVELRRGLRINAVAPTVLEESMAAYGHLFIGYQPVPGRRAALSYARSVDGPHTGRIYQAR